MTNIARSKAILEKLFSQGVDEVILCPGARNSPFVSLLANWQNSNFVSFFEERSAGFYALGRAVQSGRPKAVITTSGTAVANLLPAVIEAHYAGVPLVIVTGDRPKSYRGTGAPQTIVQPGIFTTYARELGDLAPADTTDFRIAGRGPSHLNVCFDEPLIDEEVRAWRSTEIEYQRLPEESGAIEILMAFQNQLKRPLIIVGAIPSQLRLTLLDWLVEQRCPVYLEACSGLRAHPDLSHIEVRAGAKTLLPGTYDGVLRIGSVPTTRLWRDLESAAVPVLSISELPFTGLARADTLVLPMAPGLFKYAGAFSSEQLLPLLDQDQAWFAKFEDILRQYPLSELAWFRKLSEKMCATDQVYLGNSLPIREWDLAARRDICFTDCFANRGANGIDGQLSTFFGWAVFDRRNWAIVGDLTAMYDLSAPWALKQRPQENLHIVVVNNGGGKIFQPMFRQPLFENRHSLRFEAWAEMWNLSYSRPGDDLALTDVIEVVPDLEQTEEVQKLW